MHAGICLVLERNDSSGFNPDAAKERLEAEGITVKRFDVRGSAQAVFLRADSLFGDENRQSESFENDRSVSRRLRRPKPILERDSWQSYRRPFEVLFGMSIMSLLSKRCPLSKLLSDSSGLMNNTSLSGSEKMPVGDDLCIAAALCYCPLFEVRAANCSSHVLTGGCDAAPIA